MTPDSDVYDRDPFETTALVRRLRRMSWVIAPPEVKQRVLERISPPNLLGD